MKLEPEEEKWFENNEKMPTWICTADIGCDMEIIIPAIDDDQEIGCKRLFDHINAAWSAIGIEEAREYLEGSEFRIKLGPDMTKEEWEALSEFEEC